MNRAARIAVIGLGSLGVLAALAAAAGRAVAEAMVYFGEVVDAAAEMEPDE